MADFHSQFDLGDQVTIDGDVSLVAVVIGLAFYANMPPQVQLGYVHNGDLKDHWVAEYRLEVHAPAAEAEYAKLGPGR